MSVDPRIGLELEKLNNSCEKINNLEVNLGSHGENLFIAFPSKSAHSTLHFCHFRWTEAELSRVAGNEPGGNQNHQWKNQKRYRSGETFLRSATAIERTLEGTESGSNQSWSLEDESRGRQGNGVPGRAKCHSGN